jgi:hypothetical protein
MKAFGKPPRYGPRGMEGVPPQYGTARHELLLDNFNRSSLISLTSEL